MGDEEESASAMTPVSRSGGRVRCYAPIPHPPQLPELSERVQTCLENGKDSPSHQRKQLGFFLFE